MENIHGSLPCRRPFAGARVAPQQLPFPPANTSTFVYNGDGNRVKGTVGGVTTTYIGNHFEWTGSTATMVKYYYAGSQRVAMMVGSTVYYLLTDHLDSTALTVTSAGTVYGEKRYKPWGEERYTSGTTPTTYRFTGQRLESFGLYYYGARWYDGYLNRWTQPDSIIPEAVQGVQAWDRYAYANNNPVRYSDPSGHCIGPLILVCAGILLIGAAASVAAINAGAEQVAWASSQPEVIAQEQAAAQQWQDNCMGQCHYAASVSATPGVTAGGPRPETPVSDTLALGYYNIAQGTVGVAGSIAGLTGLGLSAAQQAGATTTSASQYIDDLATDVSDWVSQGEGAQVFRNSDGDFILVNDANTRRFRFDFYRTKPHQNPHMHLEWTNDQGRWVKPGPIFPSDVDPR